MNTINTNKAFFTLMYSWFGSTLGHYLKTVNGYDIYHFSYNFAHSCHWYVAVKDNILITPDPFAFLFPLEYRCEHNTIMSVYKTDNRFIYRLYNEAEQVINDMGEFNNEC